MLKEWSRVLFRSERRYGGMFVVLRVPFVYADGLAALIESISREREVARMLAKKMEILEKRREEIARAVARVKAMKGGAEKLKRVGISLGDGEEVLDGL